MPGFSLNEKHPLQVRGQKIWVTHVTFACVCTSISFFLSLSHSAFCLNYYCAHSISGPCIWAEGGGRHRIAGSFSWSAQTTQVDITTSYVLVSYPSHCDTFSPSTLILNFPASTLPRECVCEYNVLVRVYTVCILGISAHTSAKPNQKRVYMRARRKNTPGCQINLGISHTLGFECSSWPVAFSAKSSRAHVRFNLSFLLVSYMQMKSFCSSMTNQMR